MRFIEKKSMDEHTKCGQNYDRVIKTTSQMGWQPDLCNPVQLQNYWPLAARLVLICSTSCTVVVLWCCGGGFRGHGSEME